MASPHAAGVTLDFSSTPPDAPARTHGPLAAWHCSRTSNGPVEATNSLAKHVKRVTFGIANWTHWRVRVLLHAGTDWSKLVTVTPAARELARSPNPRFG